MEAGVEALLAVEVPVLRGGMDADETGFGGQCLIGLVEQRGFADAPLAQHADAAGGRSGRRRPKISPMA